MTVFLCRTTMQYQLRRRNDKPVRERIKDIAATYIRYGQERIQKLLKREGWPIIISVYVASIVRKGLTCVLKDRQEPKRQQVD